MKRRKRNILGIFAPMVIFFLICFSVHAEEGGGGHYMPGATASFIDALPGKPGLAIADFFNYYDASGSGKRYLYGGMIAGNLDVTAYSNTILALYTMPEKILGGYYTMGVAVPYVWADVKGHVHITGPGGATITRSKSDSADGFGDITVYPFMLGWSSLDGELRYDVRLGIYVPTGEYEKGKLACLGKNYWTLEPAVSISYLSSKIGLELTAFAGVDFNSMNEDTDYQSGNQFHLDVTVAEHLPLFGGIIGLGANGFYYHQMNGDSGDGAVLGDFEGYTLGVGPVLSYATKIWGRNLVTEIKWLSDIDVEKRLEGDNIWFKLAVLF